MSPLQSHKSQSSTGSLSRANSTGAAIRRGELKISDPIPIPREGIDGFGPQAGVGSPEFRSTTSLRNPRVQSGVRASTNTAEAQADPPLILPSTKTKVWSDYSNPSHHPHDSMASTPSKLSVKKKRKDGTLKSVMRKLFGSRRGDEQRKPAVLEHHRSTQSADIKQDLGRLGVTPPKPRPPRSSSVPISEVTRASALGSHSPFTPRFDLNTEKSAAQASPEPRSHRRRATLPSIVFTQEELREIAVTLGHGMPESGKNYSLPERYDSGFHNAASNPRRRSRSAGKAQDVTREHQMSPIQWRRRSDEIKYWRSSLIEQSIPTIRNSRPPTADITEPTQAEESQPKYPVSQTPDHQDTPFDFGPLIGSIQNTESATVEQRITTLEVKVIDLEYAISKLQGHDVAAFQPNALGEPPKRRGQAQNSAPASSQSSQRYQAAGRTPEPSTGSRGQMQVPPTFLTSPTRSLVADDDQRRPNSDVNTLRPQTAVHRASPPAERPHSDETSSSAIPITAEHYKTLITLIKVEEAARKKLEDQVMQLQRQLQDPQSAAVPQVCARAYPTPSPEEHVPPTLSRQRHAPSGSMASQRTEGEGDQSDDDDGFVDVFETPSETQDHKLSIEYNSRQQMAGMI